MKNYFNQLSIREQQIELGKCRLMKRSEFANGVNELLNKNIVIVGCGSQALNQGLNMRDSGLNISYALRDSAISEKRVSFQNAIKNNFSIGNFNQMIPSADLVINLTPDKNHSSVVEEVIPLMKQNAIFSYSHGFNIVEEGVEIREDITVIMVAPKCPGSEVREEYKRGFGVPTLIAVHSKNDPHSKGLDYAKAYAVATGGHRAGVLESSFIAEVKSDLMGEQTILCGVLQTGSILSFNKMVELGISPSYASKFIQYGWETITEALKHGGITNMMDRLSNSAKIESYKLSEELKTIMKPLFHKHMDDILSGEFSKKMMEDWKKNDENLLHWRSLTAETAFEKSKATELEIKEQDYFDRGLLLVSFIKAGVELAYETMIDAGIKDASAYYESLHETPLIANTIARKKLYEMNRVISDTAEYGCYLFDHACKPLLNNFFNKINKYHIGNCYKSKNKLDNQELIKINESIRTHPIELIGKSLRNSMTNMKKII